MQKRPLLVAVLLAALAAGAAVAFHRAVAPPRERRDLNVVLVLVDTLRADHLGVYGYPRPTSPNLDAFAAAGIVFEQNRSQATCTFPSANSLLTSRYPARFLGQPERHLGIPEGIESVAEILQRRGYSTLAYSASPVVRSSPSFINRGGGFGRGFDHFDEKCLWQDAACIDRRLGERLPELPQPFFLYLHYMDPHPPYRPPADHPPRFVRPYDGYDFLAAGDVEPVAASLRGKAPPLDLGERDVGHLVDLYDEEIAHFDDRLPELLARLDEVSPRERTLVVVASDHGEEFFEHGDVKHCHAPHDTLIATPLVLRLPEGPEGRRIATPVANLDVVPTLLDYLGEDPDRFAFEGRSLRPLIEGDGAGDPGDGDPLVFSSHGLWRSVYDGRFKLLFRLQDRSFLLYDHAVDPGETTDVARRRPKDFQRLRRALFAWLEATEGGVALERSIEEALATERHLRAVGYIE